MPDNSWVYLIGILSGIIVIKTAWVDVILPVARFLGIEIHSRQHKELQLYKNEMQSFKDEIKDDLSEIKLRINDMDGMREEQKELLQYVLEGVTASLKGLQELKCNGPVSIALGKIEEFKNHKAVI